MTEVFRPNEWFRKSFSKTEKIIDPPSLMKLQLSSYEDFLQKDIPPARRESKGLQSVFHSVFPIDDFNNTVSLEFVSYALEKPKYSVKECRARGFSYEAALKVTVRLVFYDIPEGEEIDKENNLSILR